MCCKEEDVWREAVAVKCSEMGCNVPYRGVEQQAVPNILEIYCIKKAICSVLYAVSLMEDASSVLNGSGSLLYRVSLM